MKIIFKHRTTYKLLEVNPSNEVGTSNSFRAYQNYVFIGTRKLMNENSHFPSQTASAFRPMQVSSNFPTHTASTCSTHRLSSSQSILTKVNTGAATSKGFNTRPEPALTKQHQVQHLNGENVYKLYLHGTNTPNPSTQ